MELVSPFMAWIILGLILLGLEIMSATFALLFFSISAFVVALLTWSTLIESNVWQLILFGILGAAGVLIFKDKVRAAFRRSSGEKYRIDAGEMITLDHDLAPHSHAEVSYQGSKWTAVNESDRLMKAGEKATIVRVDGVKLVVK